VIGVTVRNDGEVNLCKSTLRALTLCSRFRVVAGVEQDALAVVLDEGRKAPVSGEALYGKRVVENRDAILGNSMLEIGKQEKSCG